MSYRSLLPALAFVCLSLNSFSQATGNCEEREISLRESLGTHTAVCLYSTISHLNTIHAGYKGDAITVGSAQQKLSVIIAFLGELVKSNKALIEKGLNDELDIEFVKKSNEVYEGMESQAQALYDYVVTGSEEKLKTYKKLDDENWKKVNQVLGIEDN